MKEKSILNKISSKTKKLSDEPDFALLGIIKMPFALVSPGVNLLRRFSFAIMVLFVSTLVVYIDKGGYRKFPEGDLTFLDCLYYSTVSLSTTGYGDIAPVSNGAKFTDVILITPLRLIFLAILVSSTLSVLTEKSRQVVKIQRWRKTVRNHNIIVGFGTKGQTAASTMISDGIPLSEIVIIDQNVKAIQKAERMGMVTVVGDASKDDILTLAAIKNASSIVVATNRDDTSVLVTLSAKKIAPEINIVVAIREAENADLFKHAGANSIVVSAETTGRLLGIATKMPSVVDLVEEILTPETKFSILQRVVKPEEVGKSLQSSKDVVIGVVRNGDLLRVDDSKINLLQEDDLLLYQAKKNTSID